ESVKAASDVYAPVTGEVVDANDAIVATPEAVNQDAYASWLFRIRPAGAVDAGKLLDAAAYEATVGQD
ncbi:MAG: glycine cleavage system protein H, partial [Betaproteobacteria bacterium]|nr:glycine cleavage system protein H [Betaproteobacteria bacterium]